MDKALQQLEAMRRMAVERAQLALSEARRVKEQAIEAQRDASERLLASERAVTDARAAFASESSVFGLRIAERLLRERRRTAEQTAQQIRTLAATLLSAERRVVGCREQLRAAEVARRAVERQLERRAADVSRRTEQRAEEERDEHYRALHGLRARGDFPKR